LLPGETFIMLRLERGVYVGEARVSNRVVP
jgi:hypothetical protein